MLMWYLRIYIFIQYLNCVWKSNCIWIIQKKKKVRTTSPGSGSAFGSGRVRRHGPSQGEKERKIFFLKRETRGRVGEARGGNKSIILAHTLILCYPLSEPHHG